MLSLLLILSQQYNLPKYNKFYGAFNALTQLNTKVGKLWNGVRFSEKLTLQTDFEWESQLTEIIEPLKGSVKSLSMESFHDLMEKIPDTISQLTNIISPITSNSIGVGLGAIGSGIVLLIIIILFLIFGCVRSCGCCCCCKPRDSTDSSWASRICLIISSILFLFTGITFLYALAPYSTTSGLVANSNEAYTEFYNSFNNSIVDPLYAPAMSIIDQALKLATNIEPNLRSCVDTLLSELQVSIKKVYDTIKDTEGYDGTTEINDTNTLFDALTKLKKDVDNFNEKAREKGINKTINISESIDEIKSSINNTFSDINDSIQNINESFQDMIGDSISGYTSLVTDAHLPGYVNYYYELFKTINTRDNLLQQFNIDPAFFKDANDAIDKIDLTIKIALAAGFAGFVLFICSTWCIFCGHDKCSRCQASCCPVCHIIPVGLFYLIFTLVFSVVIFILFQVHDLIFTFDSVGPMIFTVFPDSKISFSLDKTFSVQGVEFKIVVDETTFNFEGALKDCMTIISESTKNEENNLNSIINRDKIFNPESIRKRIDNINQSINDILYDGLQKLLSNKTDISSSIPEKITDVEGYPANISEDIQKARDEINSSSASDEEKKNLSALLDKIEIDINTTIPQRYKKTRETAVEWIVDRFGKNFKTFYDGILFPKLWAVAELIYDFVINLLDNSKSIFENVKLAPLGYIFSIGANVATYGFSQPLSALFIGMGTAIIATVISSVLLCIRRRGMQAPYADSSESSNSSYSYSNYSYSDSKSKSFSKSKSVSKSSSKSNSKSYSDSSSSFSSSTDSSSNPRPRRR